MKKNYLLLLFLFFLLPGFSQNPVNAYANVTAISGTSLSVNNVNETFHTFENGDYIVIMQMQDNVIGTNTTNVLTFGDAGPILSAGLFEIARINTHTESASLPTSITLFSALTNAYNINSNASVQIITFRQLGTNFTSTANIGTAAWNGTVGGVTALWVPGTFTLNHSITANGVGFRGGAKNTPNGYSTCDATTYITALAQRYAGKGEGIYKATNAAFGGARGKILTGGGGGNDVNAGGGGGGNYLSGGTGGNGWVPAGTGCSPSVGGLGGISLSASVTASRIFMGGGGGAGHENDGVGTAGANGGGIILLRTGTLVTTSCSGISIAANATNAATALNDGAGGGGAGGSIIMQVNSYSVAPACQLTVSANGGGGGSSNLSGGGDVHGGGGGGGPGVIIYSTPQPTINIATTTIPGTGGLSCGTCTSTAGGSGSGTSTTGIVPSTTGTLPVELLTFNAVADGNNDVQVSWATAVEKNNDRFILQRMNAAGLLTNIVELPAKGSYSKYSYTDMGAEDGINYYRLNQVDKDGTSNLRHWVSVNITKAPGDFVIYPNPARPSENMLLECRNYYNNPVQVELYSMTGQLKLQQNILPASNDHTFTLDTAPLSTGIYVVKISVNGTLSLKKIIISE